MSYSANKISSADMTGHKISELADIPSLNAQQLKAKFDDLAENVIVPKYNGLCDALPDVVDNLTTSSSTKVLSAKQGKVLKDLVDSKVSENDIVDNLTSTDTDKPLSAKQGKTLKDLIDGSVQTVVEDNVTSTSTTHALSANQGRVLKGLIDNIPQVSVVDNLTSESATSALSAKQGKALNTKVATCLYARASYSFNSAFSGADIDTGIAYVEGDTPHLYFTSITDDNFFKVSPVLADGNWKIKTFDTWGHVLAGKLVIFSERG